MKNLRLRHRYLPLALLLGLGFALRLYNLGAQSLWYDETVSAFLASQPVPDLVVHTALDIHPPGYYLLLRGWTLLAGSSEFALAFFSLAWGLALVALSYRLAAFLLGPATGLWTAALVATSPFNIWYGQEVRMYTLGAALGVLATYFALRALAAPPARRRWFWAGYALTAALGLYVLYYFAFLLLAVNLFLAVHFLLNPAARRGALIPWLGAQLAAVIFYLPWLPLAWRQATEPPVPPWRSFLPPWTVALESWSALALGESVEPRQVWPLLLVFAALFVIGSAAIRRSAAPVLGRSDPLPRLPLLLVYTFGPLLLIYGLSLVTPLYHVRYVFTYSPAFYLVLAAALAWLARHQRALAGIIVLLLLMGLAFSLRELHTNRRYAADDFRAAVETISDRWRPGDVILVNAGYAYTALEYYFDGPLAGRLRLTDFAPDDERVQRSAALPLVLQTGTVDGAPSLGFGDPRADFYPMSEADTAAALQAVADRYPRIWVLRAYDTVTDPEGLIRAWLREETAAQFEDRVFRGASNIRVQGFLTRAGGPPPVVAGVPFEDGLELAGYAPPPAAARPGQPLDVVLWWLPTASPSADYAVSLKLWDAAGNLAAQADEWPLGNRYFTAAWSPGRLVRHPLRLALPADLPPGQYWLDAELYDPDTVQPLDRLDGEGHVVTLGGVRVEAD